MYLSIKQHDQFRTLLMGFEIPFRGYIADVLMTHYSSANDLETALLAKNASLTPADPFFLRDVLPNSVKHSKIEKMYEALSLETFKGYHDEGLIIVDNLEAVSIDDRRKIKHFIEAQTPPEMQFLLTSRNSEEYESNTRLCGFESEDGKTFVHSYIEENALDVRLEDSEINELLDIAKGNTLVLALSLRRISQKLIDMSGLRADFSCANVWKGIRKNMAVLPPNAYESISDFMFKDTFEQIESVFDNPELFYEILRVFAVIPNKGIDLSTVCLLTNISYPDVEAVAETLCNYLIVERNGNTY